MDREELLLFGERLRARRTELGLSQENVALRIGLSPRYYQMIERGEKKVSLDTLIGISRVLTVSCDYLLFGGLPVGYRHPLVELVDGLTPSQVSDAETMLRIYVKACRNEA